jgi:hypothetical protein
LIIPAPTVTPVASSTRMNDPGRAVLGVRVAQQRHGRAQLHATDLVEPQLGGLLVAVQRVDVEAVLQRLDQRASGPGGVLDGQLLPGTHRRVGHPADHGVDVLAGLGCVGRTADHVAAGDVDVVLQTHGDRHRGERLRDLPLVQVDAGDA